MELIDADLAQAVGILLRSRILLLLVVISHGAFLAP
jgi:hypothetical protein